MKKKQELLEDGYTCYCMGCGTAYKKPPTEFYDDGHGGRELPMCSCGCDLFADLETGQPLQE